MFGLNGLSSYDESRVLDILEKVSKNVVNISTIKLVQNMEQQVYAIDNPFGLAGGPAITSGVVSALNRTIESKRELLENLVQTNAPINPGNSGRLP